MQALLLGRCALALGSCRVLQRCIAAAIVCPFGCPWWSAATPPCPINLRCCSYDVEREVVQRNAEGTLCKTTSWWEGELGARADAPAAGCSWVLLQQGVVAVEVVPACPVGADPSAVLLLTCTAEAVWLGLISCTSQPHQPVLES